MSLSNQIFCFFSVCIYEQDRFIPIIYTFRNMKANLTLAIVIVIILVVVNCQTQPPKSAPLSDKRNYLLIKMNQVRNGLGLPSLYLDSALNSIAQAHSADMVARNFFSHVNPSGLTPTNRATAAGFNYPVGENIAMATTLLAIHTNLMNSPGHYANTIKTDWTRAGVGIAYKSNGYIYVTIMFSVRDLVLYPVTAAQLQALTTKLDTYIVSKNLYAKTKIATLSTHITNWLIAGRTPSSIFTYLTNKGYPLTTMTAQMVGASWSPSIFNSLTASNPFVAATSPRYTKYGLGVYVTPGTGMTFAYVVFSI